MNRERWQLTIATPIGRQHVALELWEADGHLEGQAQGKDETVALEDLRRVGDRLTWSQRITRPIRLNLDFDVTVDGDRMEGHAKAGRLPASKVTGTRDGASR